MLVEAFQGWWVGCHYLAHVSAVADPGNSHHALLLKLLSSTQTIFLVNLLNKFSRNEQGHYSYQSCHVQFHVHHPWPATNAKPQKIC